MEGGAGGGEGGGAVTVQEAVPVPGSSPTKDLPWSRCIMGCVPIRGEEGSGRELVMMLPCLHMLCSKTCVAKLLAEHKDEAGAHISCSKCQFRVTREQLSNWINLEREFSGGSPKQKEVELICALCIFDKVATAYCPECPSPGTLCGPCVLLHPQTRSTQKHVIKHDLSELKKSPSTCQRHGWDRFTHACLTCRETLCGDCVKEHDREHKAKLTLIQAEKQQLMEKLQLARQVKDKFEAASTELGKKREDLNSRQWNKLMNGIHDQFEKMRRILTEREEEIKAEAKKHFSTESQALDLKRQDIENAKSSTDQFIKTGEILLNDKDAMASINYLRRAESYIQWLMEMEGTSIDSFAREDFHVELDTTANIQVQKAVQEYCKVSYPKDQPSEPRVVLTEILTTVRAEASRSENAPDDVEETESARRNGETWSVSDDGREVQNLTPSPSCPDVQTAATPTEMPSASSSSTTTLSPTVRESAENMAIKQELMEEMTVSDEEMEANDEEPSDPGTDDTMQISSTSASSLETPSDSELNAPNDESSTLNLVMETTTEMESDMPEDEPTTPPQTVNGAREKRQRKKSSHPDFIDWRDIQMNNAPANQLHQSEPGSRHQRRTLSGPSATGAPESVLQPMIPEAPDNRKRQRRAKRKYFDFVTADDDGDGGTQSTFEASYMKKVLEMEGGSGYISEPEVNGRAITIRRRSIRVRRKSQPGGETITGETHGEQDAFVLRSVPMLSSRKQDVTGGSAANNGDSDNDQESTISIGDYSRNRNEPYESSSADLLMDDWDGDSCSLISEVTSESDPLDMTTVIGVSDGDIDMNVAPKQVPKFTRRFLN